MNPWAKVVAKVPVPTRMIGGGNSPGARLELASRCAAADSRPGTRCAPRLFVLRQGRARCEEARWRGRGPHLRGLHKLGARAGRNARRNKLCLCAPRQRLPQALQLLRTEAERKGEVRPRRPPDLPRMSRTCRQDRKGRDLRLQRLKCGPSLTRNARTEPCSCARCTSDEPVPGDTRRQGPGIFGRGIPSPKSKHFRNDLLDPEQARMIESADDDGLSGSTAPETRSSPPERGAPHASQPAR